MSVERTTGDEPALYVSYAREDWLVAVKELEELAALGLRVWYPREDEEEFDDAARAKLKAAPFLLVLVTPDALESDAVRQEVSQALQEGKDALAVHVIETPMQGPNGLMLGGLNTVKKYRMTGDLYPRRIAVSVPDSVKSREIVFHDEPVAPPPSRGGSSSGGALAGTDPRALWGGAIGAVALVLMLLGGLIFGGGDDPRPEDVGEATGEAADTTDPADAAEARKIREERERKQREELEARRKARQEAEAKEKQRRAAVDKLRAAQALLDASEYEQAIAAFGEALKVAPESAPAPSRGTTRRPSPTSIRRCASRPRTPTSTSSGPA